MLGADRGGLIQVCDRARDFQHAVMRARREPHAADRHFERALARIVEHALLRIMREGIREL